MSCPVYQLVFDVRVGVGCLFKIAFEVTIISSCNRKFFFNTCLYIYIYFCFQLFYFFVKSSVIFFLVSVQTLLLSVQTFSFNWYTNSAETFYVVFFVVKFCEDRTFLSCLVWPLMTKSADTSDFIVWKLVWLINQQTLWIWLLYIVIYKR